MVLETGKHPGELKDMVGIDDFVKEVDAKHIFPMHFWGEYDVAERLKKMPCSAGYRDRIVEIHEEGEGWEI